jgi:DeoR/GlpR family transcriptional regulator of sugar metabolism
VAISGTLDHRARLDWLRDRLEGRGEVRTEDAARCLGVSGMTIRRDILALESQGEAHRVRGGVVAVGPATFTDRSRMNARAKARIAEKLLELVPESGAIALDSSSTVACLARAIRSARDLIVVTNSADSFAALQGKPGIRPVLTGGERDPRTTSLLGPTACHTARRFTYRVAFFSASAVHPERGAMESLPEEAEIVRAFAGCARRTVLAADATKLGTEDTAASLGWPEIDLLATNLKPPSRRLDRFREAVELL